LLNEINIDEKVKKKNEILKLNESGPRKPYIEYGLKSKRSKIVRKKETKL
jgi:hypothetical protein